MTLWLLTCYGRMRQNMLTFFHRIASHDLPWQSTSQWVFLIFWIFVSGYCLALVSRDSVNCIYCFLGILGILSENSILYGVPISVCGEGEVVIIVPEIFPHPSKARWTAAWHYSVYYPGCTGHRKPTLNTCLSNITKVYNLLSTIEMSGSSSPD